MKDFRSRCIACTPAFVAFVAFALPLAGLTAQAGHSLIKVPEQSQEEIARRQTHVRKTVEKIGPAVVHVMVKINGMFRIQRDSAGVVVSPDGLVLTAWHLVGEAEQEVGRGGANMSPMIRTADGKEHDAKIVGKSAEYDLALLQVVDDSGKKVALPHAGLGDSDTIAPGEVVLVSGRPDERMFGAFIGSAVLAQGGIRIGEHPVKPEELLLSDANLKLFVDGGPLFDVNGRVLGIVNSSKVLSPLTKESTQAERDAYKTSFGFAIRSNVARRVFREQLANHGPAPETQAERDARMGGMAGVIAKAKAAVVSVRRKGVAEMPRPDVLDPYGKFPDPTLGSGVLVHPRGLVLTNAVIADQKGAEVIVTTLDGRTFKGEVLALHGKNTALVRLQNPDGKDLPFLRLANTGAAILGERVAALGNRHGHTISTRLGVLSSKPRAKDVGSQHKKSMGHLQTDANVNDGNTGGALINLAGELLGINDADAAIDKNDQAESHKAGEALADTTIGFAIPADWIRDALRDDLSAAVADARDANPTLFAAAEVSDADKQRRGSAVTALVEQYADCFLNVFVKRAKLDKADGGLMAELFPEPADDSGFALLGQGSGVIIDPSGLALTNWHVVDAATFRDGAARKDHKVFVSLGNGQKYEVDVLSTSRDDDLALLQLHLQPGERLQAVRLGDSDAIAIGETAIAIGNPHGFANSVTVGLVTAKNRDIHIQGRARLFRGLIQTDAAINPGNSGGALIDINGYLIGINSAGNRREAKQGYAIPVNYVREKFHKTLLSSEKLRSVFTGMQTEDRLEDRNYAGTFVKSVDAVCPARDAGLQKDDRIVTVRGQKVTSGLMFVKTISAAVPFEPLALQVLRDGKTLDLSVEPVSDAAWAIFRRAGFSVKEISIAKSREALTKASVATYREFQGDPEAMPKQIRETGLLVTHVRPDAAEAGMDLQPGDIVVGRRVLVRELHLNDRYVLEYIDTVKAMRDFIRGNATKDGTQVEFWAVRGDKVIKPRALVKKVTPVTSR